MARACALGCGDPLKAILVEQLPGEPGSLSACGHSFCAAYFQGDALATNGVSLCLLPHRPWPFHTSPFSARSDGGIFLTANTQKAAAPFHRIKLASAMRCKRFLAAARCKLWWMSPSWRAPQSPIPARTPHLSDRLPMCHLSAARIANAITSIPLLSPRSSSSPPQGNAWRRRASGDTVPAPRIGPRRTLRFHYAPHLRCVR